MVAGAFYPNYFKTNPAHPDQVIKDLYGKNPRTTG